VSARKGPWDVAFTGEGKRVGFPHPGGAGRIAACGESDPSACEREGESCQVSAGSIGGGSH
jgi:hypothetical protein